MSKKFQKNWRKFKNYYAAAVDSYGASLKKINSVQNYNLGDFLCKISYWKSDETEGLNVCLYFPKHVSSSPL